MAIVYPCKDCKKRSVGCHSNCNEYAEKSRESHEINSRRFADHMQRGDVAKAMERMKKRRRIKV